MLWSTSQLVSGASRTSHALGKSDEAALVRQEFDDTWRTAQMTPSLETM